MNNKTPIEFYEKDGVSVAEMDFSSETVACYFLFDGMEVIILDSKLPENAKPKVVDFLLEKRHTETLEPVEFLYTEETPNIKGLICSRV